MVEEYTHTISLYPIRYKHTHSLSLSRSLSEPNMEKKMKVKKGWIAVEVGLEEDNERPTKFVIPISYLYSPLFRQLLDRAHEVYGYHISGPLKLPCSVDEFIHLRWRIEKESNKNYRKHHHHHLSSSLSFRSC